MNYQKELELILENIKNNKFVPKLLLHACCGPCSSYCIEYLSNYFDITIINKLELIESRYIPSEYYNTIKGLEDLGERSKRCYECYKLRMEEVAKYANINHYDYFTTTLSISPYKDANWINEIGAELEKKYNIKYLYADFKKRNGYKRSIELSREYNLYRQDYCGCVYSKVEHDKKIIENK